MKGVFVDSTSSAPSDNQSSTQKMCLACNQTFSGDLTHCPNDKTQLVPFGHDEILGSVIGDKFKVMELVGRGGMGKVYLAQDTTKKNTYVAVKMLHAQLSEDKVSVKRFQQEASAASDLQHPNLIQQYDYGMVDGKQPYLVMEYLQGDSLAELIRAEGPLNPVRCLRIFSQVMDGLHYAHEKGVVHRDIKPSNILLLEREGQEELVKVLDFGLAKLMPWSGKESQHLTKTGEVFGSPIYMSPEQCMGKQLQPTSDIYSLGITLFEALTGRPPFKGQNVVQTASKHLSDPPPQFETFCPELNLPQNLQSVVHKALEKDVAHRYHNMLQFKDDLTFAVTGQGKASLHMLAAMSADATQPVKKVDLDNLKSSAQSISSIRQSAAAASSSKPPIAIIAGALVAVLAIGGGAFFFMSGQKGGDTGGGIKAPLVSLPQSCKGTVYYLEMKLVKNRPMLSQVHIKTDKGLVKLTNKTVKVAPLDMQIGKIWQVKYKGDERTGELDPSGDVGSIKVGNNEDVADANNVVSNFFEKLGEKNFEEAFTILGSEMRKKFPADDEKAIKEFTDSYKKTSFINYRGGGEGIRLDPNIPVMSLPTSEKLPPAQASKVISEAPDKIEIMVDKSFFYAKTAGYELFTLVKEKVSEDTEPQWKIGDIAASDKAAWDKD